MTNNPSDGDFHVSQEDSAHKSRYFTFHVKYSAESWAEQAQKEKIQGPFINFILKNHREIFKLKKENDQDSEMLSMPRQWSMLFYSINHLSNLTSLESQKIITENGNAILPTALVQVFTSFLHTKEWDIPEPEWIFSNEKDDVIIKTLKKSIGDIKDQKSFNSEISSILSLRVINYLVDYSRHNNITPNIIGKLKLLIENKVFGSDLEFKIIRDIYARNKEKFKVLLSEEFFKNEILNG